jgi:hypothetical protein
MHPHKLFLCLLFVVTTAAQSKQAKQGKTDWNAPFPAHKVIGNVYFFGSAELASYYPSIADDYARSFKVLRTLPVDVFLGAHGSFYGLQAKYAKLQVGGANPFVDPAGFKAYLDGKEIAFNTELSAQKAK